MTAVAPLMTAIVLAVTLLSCVSDVRFLRIPNWHSLLILACFFPAWLAAPEAFGGLSRHLGAAGIMLAVTYLMFSFGMMGGGDSKLGTALGLWVGLKGLLPFILYMGIAGGIVAIGSLIIARVKPFRHMAPESWVGQAQSGKNAIPYGIAISFGAWMALSDSGFLSHRLNEVFNIIY